MKVLALHVLGSLATGAVLSLIVALLRGSSSVRVPVYKLGFVSALLWFPALAWSWLAPALRKEPQMPIFDWAIAGVMMAIVLAFWSLLCSIPARAVAEAYGRFRRRKACEQSRS